MARQHNKKKRSGRRPPASSLAVLAATLLSRHAYLALATTVTHTSVESMQHDDAADTSSIRKNEEAEGPLHTTEHTTNRRGLRADGSLSTVNLLVKYKHSEGHRRSLENFNNGVKDVWQSHAKSISTLSESRHISEVKIDPRYENVELIWKEMLDDDDVELVEEVRVNFYSLTVSTLVQFAMFLLQIILTSCASLYRISSCRNIQPP